MTTTEVETTETLDQTPAAGMTLVQYQQLFRTVTIGASLQSDIDMDAVMSVLDRIGSVGSDWTIPEAVGMAVCQGDEHLVDRLPRYTILEAGDQAHGWENWGLYGHNGREIVHLLGGFDVFGSYLNHLRVVEMPGYTATPTDWTVQAPTHLSAQAIVDFKRDAWRHGWEGKSEYGWCGAFETTMWSLSIFDPDSRAQTVISVEQAKDLPEGALLRYTAPCGGVAWYWRDDDADDIGLHRIFGSLPGSWAPAMEHVSTGNPCSALAWSYDELLHLPARSEVNDGYNTYVKQDDGTFLCDRGARVKARNFNLANTRITKIGGLA